MAIFPVITSEDIVQVDDKFRISGVKSYVSKGEAAITLVRIEPETGAGFIDVTNVDPDEYYLDWQYSTDGIKTATLEITTDGAPVTVTKDVTCVTEADDKLLSSDQDLVRHESDILKYVPRGKNTFKYMHRLAQQEILEKLYRDGYVGYRDRKFTKEDILDVEEFRYWSKFLVLRLIFRDLSNAIDDIFDRKSRLYENDEHTWRTKAILKIDINGDGEQGDFESFNVTTRTLVRQ